MQEWVGWGGCPAIKWTFSHVSYTTFKLCLFMPLICFMPSALLRYLWPTITAWICQNILGKNKADLPHLELHHTVAVLNRIPNWFLHHQPKLWVGLECNSSPLPIRSLPWNRQFHWPTSQLFHLLGTSLWQVKDPNLKYYKISSHIGRSPLISVMLHHPTLEFVLLQLFISTFFIWITIVQK